MLQLKLHMVTIEDLAPEDYVLRKLDAALDESGSVGRIHNAGYCHFFMYRKSHLSQPVHSVPRR